jgi:hypothetical protein
MQYSKKCSVGGISHKGAQLETLDPLILSAKIVEPGCSCGCFCELTEVPESIGSVFGDDIILDPNAKKLYVTLGQFSIIRLERDIQLLMPAYDICMPAKECSCGDSSEPEDPCDMFERFEFPVEDFFPTGTSSRVPPNPACGNSAPQNGNSNCRG